MAMTSVYDERDPDGLVLEDLFHRVPGAVKTLQFNLQGLPDAPDPQVFDTLGIVYRAFSEDVPSYKRPEVLNFFIEKVRQSEYKASILLVFVRFELNKQLVCSAVNAYLRYRQASASSAFAAVEEISTLIRNNQVANRGAVFSGLACFGDRRVNAIARTVRDCLSPEDVRVFAESVYNPLNLATLEFCIEWLFATVDTKDFAVAAQVSFALSAMVVKNKDQVVYNTEYSFGPYAFPHVIESPTCSFETWRENIAPLLAGLPALEKPAFDLMLSIFDDPNSITLEQLERRHVTTRRKVSERRASDRRIVSIAPLLERRRRDQRGVERRAHERR